MYRLDIMKPSATRKKYVKNGIQHHDLTLQFFILCSHIKLRRIHKLTGLCVSWYNSASLASGELPFATSSIDFFKKQIPYAIAYSVANVLRMASASSATKN